MKDKTNKIEKTVTKTLGKNMGNKKNIFTLKNVNTEKVDQRFGISIVSNIHTLETTHPENTTNILDLYVIRNTPEIVSFVDEAKKSHKCTISMVDFKTNKDFEHSNIYDCFWCRNQIPSTVMAIGCPLKFVPNQAIKSYYSEISKDNYSIKENITNKRQQTIEKENDSNLKIINRNYYLTDGIFCSFNCCMAYIEDNKNDSRYNLSEMLLLKMYHDICPKNVQVIDEAPHWRKLKKCGGDLTIEEFRDSFNKIEYKEYGNVSQSLKFRSVGVLFEEKLKF
jgi:6-phosphogluconate dehydrogenase